MGQRFLSLTMLGLAGAALVGPLAAHAQVPGGPGAEELQRQSRLRDLQRLEFDRRVQANKEIPPGQRVLVDYGGYITGNYLSLDDSVHDNHILREYDGIGYVRVNVDGAQEVFVAGRIGYQDFHSGDSFSGRGDEPIDGDLYRGYYRFDLRRYQQAYGGNPQPNFNVTAQGGRDLVYWGNGLVLAQVLDGGIVDVELGKVTLEMIGGITPVRTVDIDSSRPAFDYNTRRVFYGGMLSLDLNPHRPYLYYVSQVDNNEKDLLQSGSITTRYDYNSNYIGAGSTGEITGKLRYGIEGAFEFGNTLSNSFEVGLFGPFQVKQTRDDISAAAFDGRLDYLVSDPADTRLGAEVLFATGDTDRLHTSNTFGGNAPGTPDGAFNSFGLLNTGLAFSPDVSNIGVLRLGASTFPFHDSRQLRRLQVGTDFFVYTKFRKDGPIDETTANQRFLGLEPDFYLNWQVTSDVTLALRYGVFFPQADAFAIDDPRQFFFAGVTFAF